ncbi:MAG: hypothetical protein N2748_05650, partial [candidate division WOR-3 bacterium]|nr:hypothetical protein [candidate division WOR-3 bacterium]
YGTNVKYVHPTTGALQDAEIWGTYSQFNNRFVIGLTPGTEYTFDARARNGAGVLTDWGPANSQSTLSAISTFPYFQNFDGAVEPQWASDTARRFYTAYPPVNDWVLGSPAKTQITSAYSTPNCWVTKTTGNYSANHNAYVITPAFNFSAFTDPNKPPTLSFYHNFYTETGYDACIIEYTTDGVNWVKLDTATGKAVKWYNNTSTSGPIAPMKWSGRTGGTTPIWPDHTNGWVKSSRMLDMLVGQSFVRFRFRFGSDGIVHYEGWAFDDFKIEPYRDVAVTEIIRPITNEQKRIQFIPEVRVSNNGTQTENIPVTAEIWTLQQGLFEGFEGTTFPPAGWDTVRLYGTSTYNNWSRQASGTNPTCSPYQGSGMARYYSFSAPAGNACRLMTPWVSVQPTDNIVFWMYQDPGYNPNQDTLDVEITTNGT